MTDILALHRDVRRAHTLAARTLAAVGKHYADEPASLGATIEALQILHAVMSRAEQRLKDEIDDQVPEVDPDPKHTPSGRQRRGKAA